MITIDYQNKKLIAILDSNSFEYLKIYKVMKGLLTSTEMRANVWALSYDDFVILKKKLDKLGLVGGRKITNEAIEYVNMIKSINVRNQGIKEGVKNDFIKKLLKGKLKNELYEDQLDAVSYAFSNRRVGLFLPMGVGKAQTLNSKVLTPSGWVRMGDINVGDKVIDPSTGEDCTVSGVYPQGVKPIYRVTFSDGSYTECCKEHLWSVKTPYDRYDNYPGKVRSLEEIMTIGIHNNSGNSRWFIPMTLPINFKKKNLPLDPYMLGCLLGDGCLKYSIQITNQDPEIISYFDYNLRKYKCCLSKVKSNPISYNIVRSKECTTSYNPVTLILNDLNLRHNSENKFIPKLYKLGDFNQRLSLLRGLLDTDGTISKSGIDINYTSVSRHLAEDVRFLVWSFGGKASINSRITSFTHKGIKKKGKRSYRVTISLPGDLCPFNLLRKVKRWNPRTKYPPTRSIKSIDYIGDLPAQCISVNSKNSLYITDDFIVTHNTLSALASIAVNNKIKKTLVICPKSVMIGFKKEVPKHTYLKSISIPAGNRKKAVEFFKKHRDEAWDICLVHPENLVGSKKTKIYGELSELLKEVNFDMIVVDEYHQYKNITAKRTKCVLSLLTGIRDHQGDYPRVILMTGTPVSESPLNAYTVLKAIGFDRLPNIARFENYFTIKKSFTYGSKGTFKKTVGYKNLGELKTRLERVSIHRTKHDLKGFPDKTETTKYIQLTGDQKNIYKALCNKARENLSLDQQIDLYKYLSSDAIAIRLRQILNSPEVLDTKGNSVKYETIDEILEELLEDKDQKVILWTEYRKAVDLLYNRYDKKYGAVKIYGGVDNEELERIADEFEGMSGPRVACCIPAKAGTGVDFLARARTAIYVDLPYSYTLYKQSLDRIHRRVKVGKDLSELDRIRSQPATIIFLQVEETVDELVRDMLERKDDMATAVTTDDEKLISIGRADLLKYLS